MSGYARVCEGTIRLNNNATSWEVALYFCKKTTMLQDDIGIKNKKTQLRLQLQKA